MAVGGAVGQNIAGAMNNMMSGVNQQVAGINPPPIPADAFFVAIDNKPAGPFGLSVLKQMFANGQLTANSMVWKQGMPEWAAVKTIDALIPFLGTTPPPIPETE